MFHLQMPVLHQSISIPKAGLSSLRPGQAEYRDKINDVSDSHQNIETSCNSKLKLPKFKNLLIKNTEKIIKDEWLYATQQVEDFSSN